MGPDGVRLDKDGKPIKLRVMGRTSNPKHAQMGDFVKPWLKAIGIDVELQMVSDNQVNDDSTLGKYDMYFTGWGLSPDPDFQLSINLCSSMPNADGSGALTESNWCDRHSTHCSSSSTPSWITTSGRQLVKDAWAIKYEQAVNDVLYYEQILEAYRFGSVRWLRQAAGQDGCHRRPERLLGLLQRRADRFRQLRRRRLADLGNVRPPRRCAAQPVRSSQAVAARQRTTESKACHSTSKQRTRSRRPPGTKAPGDLLAPLHRRQGCRCLFSMLLVVVLGFLLFRVIRGTRRSR